MHWFFFAERAEYVFFLYEINQLMLRNWFFLKKVICIRQIIFAVFISAVNYYWLWHMSKCTLCTEVHLESWFLLTFPEDFKGCSFYHVRVICMEQATSNSWLEALWSAIDSGLYHLFWASHLFWKAGLIFFCVLHFCWMF